jgi:hypothetical protein
MNTNKAFALIIRPHLFIFFNLITAEIKPNKNIPPMKYHPYFNISLGAWSKYKLNKYDMLIKMQNDNRHPRKARRYFINLISCWFLG